MKGEIWLVVQPSANGHEQQGERPAIVLAEMEAKIARVIPFTTNILALRFPHTVEVQPSTTNELNDTSIALVFQLRAIDKKRLKKRIGNVEEKTKNEIDAVLRNILQL